MTDQHFDGGKCDRMLIFELYTSMSLNYDAKRQLN